MRERESRVRWRKREWREGERERGEWIREEMRGGEDKIGREWFGSARLKFKGVGFLKNRYIFLFTTKMLVLG